MLGAAYAAPNKGTAILSALGTVYLGLYCLKMLNSVNTDRLLRSCLVLIYTVRPNSQTVYQHFRYD